MSALFRSKSCGFSGITDSAFFHRNEISDGGGNEEESVEIGEISESQVPTPFISPESSYEEGRNGNSESKDNQFTVLDFLVAALRKSLVTCSVETEDVASMEISWPSEVRHVSHVTFDRFGGFLGLPTEFEPEVPRKAPSASATVFGVSAKSMQCSYDERGNSVPTILLMMQRRLYCEGGLKAEGIFRINGENSKEDHVRNQLNNGIVPRGIDVHCLAGLIKAWFRELPTGVLDCLTPDQVMRCNSEEDCTLLVNLLPPTEAALLNWAINLMADVVEHERYNKMNARNIAMVFAPNMTQMADPLTALIHAVQVMNFLKTLILMTLREREELTIKSRLLSSGANSPSKINSNQSTINEHDPREQAPEVQSTATFLRAATLSRLEFGPEEKLWSFHKNEGEDHECESIGSGRSARDASEIAAPEDLCKGGYGKMDRLSLGKGVRRLCRHPVFQLSKPPKKTRNIGIMHSRGGGGEAWSAWT